MTKFRLSSSILVLLILLAPLFVFANTQPDTSKIMTKAAKIQIPFIENQGQIQDKSIKFYANTFAGNVYVTDKGKIVYGLANKEDSTSLRETLIGSTPSAIKGESKSVTNVNYFVGNKDNWKSNIPTFESVNLGEVYEGVELKLKAYGKNVEKLFYVNECGDVENIKLTFDGAEDISVNENGELEIETKLGTVKFTKPFAYQEIDGKKIEVKCNFVIDSLSYSFRVASYDKNYPLIIDPLLASTFLGSNEGDGEASIALDSSGNIFVAGTTMSSNFPTTAGAYDISFNGGIDVIISKFDNNLTSLLASTYLGDYGDNFVTSITADSSGNVFVIGYTSSGYFPTTAGAYDVSLNGRTDVFVSKLDNNLTSLLASTYLGGSGYDFGYSISLDSSGNVFVTGSTAGFASSLNNFPTTAGAYDASGNDNGSYYGYGGDVFISKLDNNLTSLLASTFLGGSYYDDGKSMTIDSSGNIFITGETHSNNFPTTAEAYDISGNGLGVNIGTDRDAFISKLDNNLTSLLASTFLGGNSDDFVQSVSADSSHNIFVTGQTHSSDFPTTAGAYDISIGYYDAFISKLDNNLTSLLASTFLGGNGYNIGYSITTDSSGNVFVTGNTSFSDFPTTAGAYDTSFNNVHVNFSDAFISKFDNSLTSLLASTFLGADDYGNSIILDSSGNIFVAGTTISPNFPTTAGAYDTSFNGIGSHEDVFVSKFDNNLSQDLRLAGRVYSDGYYESGIAGITVTANSYSTVTDSLGDFTINVFSNGVYTVTPTKSGYIFDPSSRTVTISNSSQIGLDFIGTPVPTAIDLSSFTATQSGKKVLITWQTATELDNLGFNILRSESESGQYTKINKKLIKSKGSSTKGASYKLKDKNIESGKTYWYKLEDIDSNTGPAQHDAVKVEVTAKKVKAKK